ncbi:VWA domain-containing protein [Kitasatospora sp. NA04385]|uniref:vWA domain-containing protein n=1 Tax=Kitasatospora sp. NA04385 TaxID=2742135 RepID=UPI00159135B9|nr:VWA domain-containing protein [Kitasatospora sp. NA04385]QKW18082.1 VWA domain-containing protein [Kitasatospora sp. NA04385]
MTATPLAKGANLPIDAAAVRADLSWRAGPGVPGVGAAVLLLGADGGPRLLRGTERAPGVVLRPDGADVDPAALPPGVQRVLLLAVTDGGGIGAVPGLSLLLSDARTGAGLARFDPAAGAERALVCGELYLRAGRWKFRAVGQGWTDGLAGLAFAHGFTLREPEPVTPEAMTPEPVTPEPEPVTSGQVLPEPVLPEPVLPETMTPEPVTSEPVTPGQVTPEPVLPGAEPFGVAVVESAEERALPVEMRKRLSLRKQQVAVSLRKHGAQRLIARVVLVLDASGSMSALYHRGVVADVVERMAAVAAQLDDDGAMQAWTFASQPARLPDLRLADLPEWLRLHVRVGEMSLFGRRKIRPPLPDGRVDMRAVGIQNEEQKVIAQVRDYVRGNPAQAPTLVLFFSDGGVYRNTEIERELRAAVEEPVFWQFVGLGHGDYGVLERFDALPGRRVDNVGFFAVDDISTLPDPELYDRLLSEFPRWVAAARRAGILR